MSTAIPTDSASTACAHRRSTDRVCFGTADMSLRTAAHSFLHDCKESMLAVSCACDSIFNVCDNDKSDLVDCLKRNSRAVQTKIERFVALCDIYSAVPQPRPIDMNVLVKDVLEHTVDTSAADISIELEELPCTLADEKLVRILLQELINNAIQFRVASQQLTVSIMSVQQDGRNAYVVADNGIGFDPAHSSRLFEAFRHLHSRERSRGAGVGLAIARLVVEKHGGRIWATSASDSGTSFAFTLNS